MSFNSLQFAAFFPTIFILYWFVFNKNLKVQNVFLLISSYFFYASWNRKFLFLLIFSTFLDYFTGLQIWKTKNKKIMKFWLWLSIITNLGLLGFFKYYNFFTSSFADLMTRFGIETNPWILSVILPVGISFYTFHGLSYVIDIYYDRIKAEKNFITYGVFVSFFPLLVAWPIERATHLLPQIKQKRMFTYPKAVLGMRQILWGFFKKIVIADQCGQYVSIIFDSPSLYSASTLFLWGALFIIQVYWDFSGYSDIALWTARLLGIDLLRNFNFPFFSRSIAEFWRRWHISLTSWFRDYLYIPLGWSRWSTWMKIRNIFIIFIVTGFWHGANWTFIIWWFVNALYIIPSVIFHTNRNNLDIVAKWKYLPSFKEFIQIIMTFTLTVLAIIIFRSKNLEYAWIHISRIFSFSFFSVPTIHPTRLLALILVFITIEWFWREEQFAIANLNKKFPKALRWIFYYILIFAIYWFSGNEKQFIYFEF